MAEPIGLASGLLALATFAFQCSKTLYETVRSFQSHPKRVRDLLEELEALSAALGPLTDIVRAKTEVDLSALDLPLLRCGNACKEFEQVILQCSSQSGTNRTSFRGWAKLTYMGDGIDGFRQLLSSYKLTINIALTDANLRTSTVTAERLDTYKSLIKAAKDDLEARLESIDGKLERIFERTVSLSDPDASEMRLIKEERLSTEKCLQICSQLAEHIDQIQPTPNRSGSSSGSVDPEVLSERVTNEGLQLCRNSLAQTATRLEGHLKHLIGRLLVKSKSAMASDEELAELTRLQDEWETARQCMGIWSRADHNLKENISVIENHATGGDAWQYMISTNGQVLHGKNEGHGGQIRQMGGHMSDEAVMQLSRDMVRIASMNVRPPGDTDPSSRGDATPPLMKKTEVEPTVEFGGRYGPGFKLVPESSPEITTSSTRTS